MACPPACVVVHEISFFFLGSSHLTLGVRRVGGTASVAVAFNEPVPCQHACTDLGKYASSIPNSIRKHLSPRRYPSGAPQGRRRPPPKSAPVLFSTDRFAKVPAFTARCSGTRIPEALARGRMGNLFFDSRCMTGFFGNGLRRNGARHARAPLCSRQ